VIAVFVIIFLKGCWEAKVQPAAGGIGKKFPLTRGQAVKMLAMSRYTIDEINALPREIALDDSDISNWCDKYINAAHKAGIISGTQENTFLQNDTLTLEQANFILKKASEGRNLVLEYDNADRKKPISAEVWLQMFDAIKGGAEQREIVILADKKTCPALRDGYVLTSGGLMNSEGVNITEDMLFCGVNAYVRGNCILALTDITETEPVLKNVLVKKKENGGVLLGFDGFDMYFPSPSSDIVLEENKSYDLKISGGKVIETKQN
ncbi:MAG: S-layer homology domain-containing protein, partial [Firmicutes bacterium]|nr:S-layer homology domain-containing protein [Bacillota bacterium]